jgi:hypothetical protein
MRYNRTRIDDCPRLRVEPELWKLKWEESD